MVAAGYDELTQELAALDALAPILGSWSLPSSSSSHFLRAYWPYSSCTTDGVFAFVQERKILLV